MPAQRSLVKQWRLLRPVLELFVCLAQAFYGRGHQSILLCCRGSVCGVLRPVQQQFAVLKCKDCAGIYSL